MTIILGVFLTVLFLLFAIPFILLGLLLGAGVYALGQLLLLPFRMLGAAVHMGAGVIFFFVQLFLVLAMGAACLIALAVGFLPVLPVLLIGVGLWILFRSGRRQRPRQAV